VLKLARIALDNGDLPAPEAVGTMSTALAVLAMIACDELQPPRRLAASTTEWARAQGAPGLYAMHAYWLALIAQHEGDLRSVEAACSAAVDAGSGGAAAPLVAALVAPCRSEAEIERGRVEAARVAFDATGLADVPVEQMPIATPLYTRGRILRAEGQLHAALEDFIACGERLKWHGNRNPSLLLPWRFHAAQLHLELGERDKANAIAEENLQLARQFGAASSVGVALQLHGSILGGDAGLAELHEAVKLLGASPARLAHAKALVDLGATLRRSGQRRLARDALRRGMELAAECDAIPIAARAEDELRASGARLLGRPVTGIDALTPSEHRVASLAASGHTNPQIAQSLFLSLKTVEMHLGRTYRKLGIKSREQLGDALTATPDDQPERKQASA
jgi:DNA-binding CsgD family transcriptional regulator